MQTFLPSEDLRESVAFLDNKRLGKQRVETKQILIALGVTVGQHVGRPESGWRNHPASKMWKGYEPALALYGYFTCREWVGRGFRDSLTSQFECALNVLTGRERLLSASGSAYEDCIGGDPAIPSPWWLGYPKFHRSHRSNLLRKDYSHYRAYFTEPSDLPYFWPV